ncbi:MAG: hypothetical protein AAGD07_10030 [Planctomycetota bacterium]
MLEIFALPYFAVSGVIGWVIFEPFLRANDSETLSRASVVTTDLLAICLPVGVLLALARWGMPEGSVSPWLQLAVIAMALLFAMTALTTGLFLVPKKTPLPFIKRMTLVGIIAPSGILLMMGWIALLIYACFFSVVYFAPSSIAIALATLGLRVLSVWVCRQNVPSSVD